MMRKLFIGIILFAGFSMALASLAPDLAFAQGFQRPTTGGPAPVAPMNPQMGGSFSAARLKPEDDWTREEVKIFFLPEQEVATIAAEITQALGLQSGQINTFQNKMLLYGSPKDLESIKKMIKDADQPPRHIIFEATLINVDTDKVKEVGSEIFQDYSDKDSDKEHTLVSDTDFGIAGNFNNTIIWSFDQGGNTFNLTAGYLLERGVAEIVSKPVVRVKNGGSGDFKIVTNVPQKTVSDKGTRVEYKATGIKIQVDEALITPSPTPNLTKYDEGYMPELIYTKLQVTDGTIGLVTTEGITTNDTEVTSEGYFRSGETMIIASLVKDTKNQRTSLIPVLWKLPVIGKAFKKKTNSTKHTETLILMRTTIEDEYAHKFLASHFDSSQDLLSIELGGRNRDSITVHPFSDAKWKSVPQIYDPSEDNPFSYWKLNAKYTDEEIEDAANNLFRRNIRNRVGLLLEQKPEQIRQQILHDAGMEDAVAKIQATFREKWGKEPPTAAEFLVAAAHHGVLNQWAFDVYEERLINQ